MAARRPGLIAKKISVRAKLGKRHMRTYWVRPEAAAAMRLRRARDTGERTEHVWSPQAEHPRAQLKAWFEARKARLDDDDLKSIIKLFQRPDGRMVEAADFDRLFANPGKMTFPMKKTTGRQTPWHQPETEFEKNPDGSKLMKSFNVRIVFDGLDVYSGGRGMSASLRVIGTPIFPEGHPRAGEPTGESDVVMNDSFGRSYNKNGDGSVSVSHNLFVMRPEYQGSGLGADVIENQFMAYEEMGISKVDVHGLWMGQYYWGRIGFEATASNRDDMANRFKDAVTKLQRGTNSLRDCSNAKDGYPYRTKLMKPDGTPTGTPYTVAELVALHSYTRPDGSTRSTSDVYATKIKVMIGGVEKEIQVWKDAMLTGETHFYGGVKVAPGEKSYESVRAYFGRRPAIGTPEGDAFDAAERERLALRAAERPRNEARTLELIEPEERAQRARDAEAARLAAIEAERRRVEEAAAEARRREMALIREPILNPVGELSANELHSLIDNRVDNTIWNQVNTIPFAGRAAWVADSRNPGTAAERQRGADALSGQLSAQRVNAARDLVQRYTLLGETDQANRFDRSAREHMREGQERARQDEGRGNPGAYAAFEATIVAGDTARLARNIDVAEIRRTATERIAAAERERVERVRVETEAMVAREAATAARIARETAVRSALGEEPAAAPRGSNVLARIADYQSRMLRLATPEARQEWVNNAYTGNRGERQAALNEMTGAAARARAAYATRQAAHLASTGDATGARNARARATRENRAAEAAEAAFSAREAEAASMRSDLDTVAPLAADLANKSQAALDDVARQMEPLNRAYRNAAYGSTEERAARDALNPLRARYEELSRQGIQLRNLAARDFLNPNSEEDEGFRNRRAAAVTAALEKDTRVQARRAENAERDRAAREAAEREAEADRVFNEKVAPDRARAQALLSKAQTAFDEANTARFAANTRLNDAAGTPQYRVLLDDARAAAEHAGRLSNSLARISQLAGVTRADAGQVPAMRTALQEKEGRIAERVAREAAERKAAVLREREAERAFAEKVVPDRARARDLLSQARSARSAAEEAADKTRTRRNEMVRAGVDRNSSEYQAVVAEDRAALEHLDAMATSFDRINALANNPITRADTTALTEGRTAIAAKENRIQVRAQEAKERAAQEARAEAARKAAEKQAKAEAAARAAADAAAAKLAARQAEEAARAAETAAATPARPVYATRATRSGPRSSLRVRL